MAGESSRAAVRPPAAARDAAGERAEDAVVDRLLSTGLALAVLAVALQTVTHLLNFALFDLDVEQLDAGSDSGAWAWSSTVATFAAAFAALLLAAAGPNWRTRWLVLAGILAFLSLDDLLQVHEYSGDWVEELGIPEEWELRRAIWPAVFLPLLATAFLLLLRLARSARPRERRFLLLGLGQLAAAVAIEALTPVLFWFDWEQETWPYELEQVVEEGAELGGWMLIAAGLTAVAVRAVADHSAERAEPSP
jgi:uncharacterized membrane protein YidH (DUF202 family)